MSDPANRAEPESAQQALARARDHADAAAREGLAAVAALLDAIALASSGEPSAAHRVLGPATRIIESLRGTRGDRVATRLLESIADALDEEIARWEQRSIDDSEARSVWRAFVGLRELLWEFGVRPTSPDGGPGSGSSRRSDRAARATTSSRKARGKPVQRVVVEG